MDLVSVIAFQKSLAAPARRPDATQPANATLRALDEVHQDYLKLHRRATSHYWAPPASPTETPTTTPATSPTGAAARPAKGADAAWADRAFTQAPLGFWEL